MFSGKIIFFQKRIIFFKECVNLKKFESENSFVKIKKESIKK